MPDGLKYVVVVHISDFDFVKLRFIDELKYTSTKRGARQTSPLVPTMSTNLPAIASKAAAGRASGNLTLKKLNVEHRG